MDLPCLIYRLILFYSLTLMHTIVQSWLYLVDDDNILRVVAGEYGSDAAQRLSTFSEHCFLYSGFTRVRHPLFIRDQKQIFVSINDTFFTETHIVNVDETASFGSKSRFYVVRIILNCRVYSPEDEQSILFGYFSETTCTPTQEIRTCCTWCDTVNWL